MTSAHTNVNFWERLASVTGGSALVAYGLTRRSLPGSLVAVALGAPLLQRGWTGHCNVYQALDISTAAGEQASADSAAAPKTLTRTAIHVSKDITIERPLLEVFRFWSNFENLPRFMQHLESVTLHQDGCSHWVAKAPLGMHVEWDADIVDFEANKLISWRSRPGSVVPNEGCVRFNANSDGSTAVHVSLDYHPPAGAIGATIARVFGAAPEVQVEDDLKHFKEIMESSEIGAGTQSLEAGGKLNDVPAPGSKQYEEPQVEGYRERLKAEAREHKAEELSQTDEAVDQTFPASDPPAW